MQEIIVSFAKENLVPLAYAVAWYVLAGFIAALFGRKSRIDAWCEANPGLALVLNFLRATGFDMWKILAALKTLADAKSKIPPIAPAFILLGALAAGGTQVGCGRAAVDVQLDKIEDYGVQVQGYVDYLESVFQVAVNAPGLDPVKKQELLQKFASGREQFNAAFDAFVAGLRAAREANAETVDINALVGTLVTAVTKIIDVIELVGANPLWIQDQRAHAVSLSRGI